MANHLPPTVEEDQVNDQAQDANHVSSTFQSQDTESPEAVLRNAPTFPLEENSSRDEKKDTAASSNAGPGPSFLEKMMQKLGLNSIILMSMFKSVFPVSVCRLV